MDTTLADNTAGTEGESLFLFYEGTAVIIDSPAIASMDISDPTNMMTASCMQEASVFCQNCKPHTTEELMAHREKTYGHLETSHA